MALSSERDPVPHFGHPSEPSSAKLSRAAGPEIVPVKAAVLIALKRSPRPRICSNAYPLSCNGCALRFGVHCTGAIVSPSRPFRTACSLRRTSRSLVRMVHARSGRQRSGVVVQSGSIMGALWIGRRRSVRRRDRRLASSCWKNCRPGERSVDRSKWQRRWRRQDPSEVACRCHRIQKCICCVLGNDLNRACRIRQNALRPQSWHGMCFP